MYVISYKSIIFGMAFVLKEYYDYERNTYALQTNNRIS